MLALSSTKDLTKTYWELRYPLVGKSLPADHGHRLYGAMSRIRPEIHESNSWRMATISGVLNGYAIAIPDVRHLATFCEHFPAILKQRKTEEL